MKKHTQHTQKNILRLSCFFAVCLFLHTADDDAVVSVVVGVVLIHLSP